MGLAARNPTLLAPVSCGTDRDGQARFIECVEILQCDLAKGFCIRRTVLTLIAQDYCLPFFSLDVGSLYMQLASELDRRRVLQIVRACENPPPWARIMPPDRSTAQISLLL